MIKIIKHYLKNSPIIFNTISYLLYTYLKFSYLTSSWQFIMPPTLDHDKIDQENGLFFAIWHNQLAYGLQIFDRYNNIYALASPHIDGKIISKIIKLNNQNSIEGSSNKNSLQAIKQIINKIQHGAKIVLTPDGPKGPVHKNSSIVTKIANNYNKKVIPVSCHASSYFELKSWDKMIIPKPFSKIVVLIDEPIILEKNEISNRQLLEDSLNTLNQKAKKLASR